MGYLLEGRDEYGVEMTVSGPCYLSALLLWVWASFTVGVFSLGAAWTALAPGLNALFQRKSSAHSSAGLNH